MVTDLAGRQGGTSPFGIASVVLGFIALATVVAHFFAGPIEPPPPLEVSIADKAVQIRDATVAALRGDEYVAEAAQRVRTLDDYLVYAALSVAGCAILLGLIGFLRREPLRASLSGAALGAMAITFQVALMVFFALLFVFLLSNVLDNLDFSF